MSKNIAFRKFVIVFLLLQVAMTLVRVVDRFIPWQLTLVLTVAGIAMFGAFVIWLVLNQSRHRAAEMQDRAMRFQREHNRYEGEFEDAPNRSAAPPSSSFRP